MELYPFEAKIWPEAQLPAHAAGCTRCSLAGQRKKIVWGEGNPEGAVYILLDNPGAREDAEGQPYVCGTRETLQKAAHEAGFHPDELFVTYLLKCRPIRAYDKDAARAACLPYLGKQLESRGPLLLFCMGNVAVQAYFGNPLADVKSMRGRLHEHNGRMVAVTYHPLAVRRRPNLYALFLRDWELARTFLTEKTF